MARIVYLAPHTRPIPPRQCFKTPNAVLAELSLVLKLPLRVDPTPQLEFVFLMTVGHTYQDSNDIGWETGN